jgi:branched-chain amino acid transport system ATP-binding protein
VSDDGQPRVGLVAEGLVRRYGGLTAVDHVDLTVAPGKITGLIGANGAGKSTLFSLLTGVEHPDEGRVRLGHRDVTKLSPDARARRGLVQTFQVPSLFPSMTVADNLMVATENRGRGFLYGGLLGLPSSGEAENRRTVAETLDALGLAALAGELAGTLPTGALRLAELARALCTKPHVLLLDEPGSGLDGEETDRLSVLLRQVADDGLSVLLVDHDTDLVFAVVDRVYAMAGGKIVAQGDPESVRNDPLVRSTYLDATGTLA